MTLVRLADRADAAVPEKVQPQHRERLAVVYVRQSTLQQVHDHQESTQLQYGLAHTARQLGWPAERVLVIDDDLGKSGSTSAGRLGFQRLVTEVTLNHVGLILGLEMSRLARSNTDWHHLLEVCALFRTLIADQDGLYDPGQYNDRLLLGLKGTMSEAELHILKQRLHAGKLNKARRGDLASAVPIGYVRLAGGEIALDPDEQVQAVVRLIFRKFDELGTLHALLQYLVRHGIELGVRERCGDTKGRLVWRRPNRMTLQNMLHHPMYAGAYCYGRRQIDPRRKRPGRQSTGRVVRDPRDWHALIRDRVPAYIAWAAYEAHLARLEQNRSLAEARGSARRGHALLTGLLVCGRCGHRMIVRYRGGHAGYVCQLLATNYGGSSCQHIAGDALEAFVTAQVLRALEPAGIELALHAAQQVEQERADLEHVWQQRLERARYETTRAERQYAAVEPEHRLVARQLERAWEGKLVELRDLQDAYERFMHDQPRALTREQLEAIRQLADDLPGLWAASTTTVIDRKEILRAIIERIVLWVIGESEQVQVEITWVGGHVTRGVVCRPVQRLEQLSMYARVCAEVTAGVQAGESAAATVARLNALGLRSPRGIGWSLPVVRELTARLGLRRVHGRPSARGPDGAEGTWGITALARALDMPASTLYEWIERGEVPAERLACGRLRVHADAVLMERLRARRAKALSDVEREIWRQRVEGEPCRR
jgi:DNA invertase Pin-like site-specific DNA recombinase